MNNSQFLYLLFNRAIEVLGLMQLNKEFMANGQQDVGTTDHPVIFSMLRLHSLTVAPIRLHMYITNDQTLLQSDVPGVISHNVNSQSQLLMVM
jgi:hypothetical protein